MTENKRIFALCQKCGKRIYECVDFMETANGGVIFRIKCPHCGWEFSHQILVAMPKCAAPNKEQLGSIIDMVMEKMGVPKNGSDDPNKYRVK